MRPGYLEVGKEEQVGDGVVGSLAESRVPVGHPMEMRRPF